MKKVFLRTFVFFLLYFFIQPLSVFAQNENSESKKEPEITTITIKNARETDYKKNEEGQDCIILEGSVRLIVEKNGNESEIKAEHVTYNRSTEMLFAQGNVTITTKSSNSGGETTTATSLLLNTSTLEGVFDGGKIIQTQSDAINLPGGSTLIVFSDLFGKTGNNVITFKNSSLTFCDDENPHWHIDATRTWLLPGGEFAFFNALLYVGVVPVMYFPAFYYPKDELVFNPVFSFTPRAGYSIQTTSYVFGRKPLDAAVSTSDPSQNKDDSEDSTAAESIKALYNFMKPTTLKEQVQEGIVLHNLDQDYKGDTTNYVKVMGDWYSNLGYHVGFDGNLQPSKTYLTSLKFNLNLGFSRTVFLDQMNGQYYPFSTVTGLTYNDKSDFLGMKLPFRYAANIDLKLNKPLSVSLSVPIYSDPYFSYDFLKNRYETMDWISYMLDNINGNEKKEGQPSEISNFEWKFTTSANPSVSVLNPYISSVSLNHNSSVNISSKEADFTKHISPDTGLIEFNYDEYESLWSYYTPQRRFYYPSSVTPLSTNMSVSGTIFSWPVKRNNSIKKTDYITKLNMPDLEASEKENEASEEQNSEGEDSSQTAEEGGEKAEGENEDDRLDFDLKNTELSYDIPKVPLADGFAYKLSYSVRGNFMNQYAYSSLNLKIPSDFDWNNYRSYMYTIKTPVTLSSNTSYGGSFISMVNDFTYSPVFQSHPYISDKTEPEGGYTDRQREALKLADYNAEAQDILNNNTVTLKPFVYSSVLSDSSLSWNISEKVFKRTFIGTVDEPEWKNETVDFTDEKFVTSNSLTAVIACAEFNKKLRQSLTLGAVMRPLLMQYTASANVTFPHLSVTAGSGIKEVTKEDVPYEDKWKKNPFTQSLNLHFFDSNLSFTEDYIYNLEENYHDSLKLSLSAFKMLQVIYLHSYSYGYDFSKETGWKQKQEKEFIPYSLTFSFAPEKKTYYRWFNRVSIAPGLNMSLVADLRRSTDSYFTFSPSLSFKIFEFLELTFSSTSRNSVLYWYFHNEEGDLYSEWGGLPGNIVKDLIDSFNFGDEKKRSGSGFKLKSFELTASHDLHDWKMNMQLKIEPRLLKEAGQKPRYDFNPYFTVGIIWNPMESIKTSIIDEYGEWKIE